MSYRGPNQHRIVQQRQQTVDAYAGYTALWRQYVSATTGAAFAGRGDTLHYREQWITAHMYGVPGAPMTISERQVAAGMIADGKFFASVPVRLGPRDELIWMGQIYRVEGTPVPAQLDGYYSVPVKRGE